MATYTERAAGIYRAKYVGQIEKPFTDQETGETEVRWIWKFQEVADPTTAGQIDKITGTSLQSPNSNAYKMAAGIVGRKLQPGDDTEAFVGHLYDVVYGPNQAGNLTITSVVKATPVSEVIAQIPVTQHPRPVDKEAEVLQSTPAAGPPPELP